MSFKNTILIISFNYSDALNNRDRLIDLYKDHFKEIIIYSDVPVLEGTDDVNYVNTERGFYTQRIFNHFYDNYKEKLDDIDGLFYTHDDNIINLNILNVYDSNKIVYNFRKNRTNIHWIPNNMNSHRGREKKKLVDMHYNNDYPDYDVEFYRNEFSDYFYLPKRYLHKHTFELFHVFGKHKIFLDVAISTVIYRSEPDITNYNTYTQCTLWKKFGPSRKSLENLEFVKSVFNKKFDLFVHPIKFNSNPKALDWISDIFQKKKCVIITTINPVTETIRKHMDNEEYDVIIVGDKKTPDCYKNENCIYLDVDAQEKLFPRLSKLIPYNHYGRKNLGYLFAVKRGYEVIYETDDDNIPFNDFDNVLNFDSDVKTIQENDSEWINIFKYFTNNNWIWPRGYPLSHIKKHPIPNYTFEDSGKDISIINGLVENDPDVDALFRLICNHQVTWDKDKKVIISNKNVCVFNTQNTFWVDSAMFIGLLLPCSVTFRYCDILKGLIANMLLRYNDKNMAYISPNVTQLRNEHDLMSDFESEYSMYIANEKILSIIQHGIQDMTDNKQMLYKIYQNLFDNNIITQLDLDICKVWLNHF